MAHSVLPPAPAHPDGDQRRGETDSESLSAANEPKRVGGVRLTTLLLCAIPLTSLGGTIALWVYAAMRIKAASKLPNSNSAASLSACIHVVFVVIFLAELVFLQRAIHRLRRERRQRLRSGAAPPPQQLSPLSSDSLAALAPWNRPRIPILRPTEDHLTAISPPPAQGNKHTHLPR